jgi:hypothetical protein
MSPIEKDRAMRISTFVRALAVVGATIVAAERASAQQDRAQTSSEAQETKTMEAQSLIGMWVTADGYVRQELLPNGRYDEARGTRKSAYQGRYTITGNRIDYVDDTGFSADGEFIDGVLHHGGMLFYRER